MCTGFFTFDIVIPLQERGSGIIVCIEKMKRLNSPQILIEKGQKLKDGLIAAAAKYGYDLHVSGVSSLFFYLRIADEAFAVVRGRHVNA